MYVKCLLLLNVKRIILFTVKQKSFVLYYKIDNTVQFTHTCDYSHTCSSLTSLVSGSLIKGGSGAGIIVWVVRTIEGTAGIIEGAVGVIEGDEVKGMYRGDIFYTAVTTSCARGVANTYVSERGEGDSTGGECEEGSLTD